MSWIGWHAGHLWKEKLILRTKGSNYETPKNNQLKINNYLLEEYQVTASIMVHASPWRHSGRVGRDRPSGRHLKVW